MINNVENKTTSYDAQSDLEYGKNKIEMLRYRENSLSYMLGLLGLIFSVFAAFIGFNSMNPGNIQVILKIALNIALLLFGFLFCEKAKSYSKSGSIALIAFGTVCIARIFWIPLQLIVNYSVFAPARDGLGSYIDYSAEKDGNVSQISTLNDLIKKSTDAAEKAEYQKQVDTLTARNLELDALMAPIISDPNFALWDAQYESSSKYLGKTITARSSDPLVNYLPQDGNFRGILAIILLVAAAGCLITAGVIGVKQSTKLNTYLDSLKEGK